MGVITEHIRKKLVEDIRAKGLLIWLDNDHEFTHIVDTWLQEREQGTFPYDIYAFRGSFLELMIESQEVLSGKIKPKYCVHPNCNCSDVYLSLYILGGTHIAESISTIKCNYRKNSWELEDSIDNESKNLVRQLLAEKRGRLSEIGRICKERHRILRQLYSRYRERKGPTEFPDMPLLNNQKVGRNDPCPCGSGLKYKKCCGR